MANEQTRGLTDFATQETETDTGIRDRARDVVGQAKDRASEQLESKISTSKSRAAETLSGVAQSLRSSTQQLRDDQHDGASRVIERAADGVERFASYLQDTNVDEVIEQVHAFARRQPAAFIGGAFALGFLASRFIKASTPDDRRRLYGTSDRGLGYEGTYDTTRGYTAGRGRAYSTDRGYAATGGYGNTGDVSGSLGYGAGLSTTGGGSTGGGYRATPTPTRTDTDDLGDGTPGLSNTERDRTGGNDVGSR